MFGYKKLAATHTTDCKSLATIYIHMHWIKRMYRSKHFRLFLVICMACALAVSVFLTILLAYDNAQLRKVNNIICKV